MLAYVNTVLAFVFQNEGNFLTGETLLHSQKGLCSVQIVIFGEENKYSHTQERANMV